MSTCSVYLFLSGNGPPHCFVNDFMTTPKLVYVRIFPTPHFTSSIILSYGTHKILNEHSSGIGIEFNRYVYHQKSHRGYTNINENYCLDEEWQGYQRMSRRNRYSGEVDMMLRWWNSMISNTEIYQDESDETFVLILTKPLLRNVMGRTSHNIGHTIAILPYFVNITSTDLQ